MFCKMTQKNSRCYHIKVKKGNAPGIGNVISKAPLRKGAKELEILGKLPTGSLAL